MTNQDHYYARPILLSIRTEHVSNILSGSKQVEFRRRAPTQYAPFQAALYSSRDEKSIRAIATITRIFTADLETLWAKFSTSGGISRAYFNSYFDGCDSGHGLELSNVEELATPIPLSSMRSDLRLRPPQSWQYLSLEVLQQISNYKLSAETEE